MRTWLEKLVLFCLAVSVLAAIYFRPVHGQTTINGVANQSVGGATTTQWFLNGVLQSNVRCDVLTGTTATNGTGTISYAGMGFTTIMGISQPVLLVPATTPATINTTASTNSSVSVYVTSGSVVTILTINVISFSAAALPYSVTVCGV